METDQYLDVFIDESAEHLETLYQQLLELENNPTDPSIIEEIFRAAHTIKGMSASMGYQDLANVTHYLENVFDLVRDEKISIDAYKIDILFKAVDQLNEIIEDIASGGDGTCDIEKIIAYLNQLESSNLNNQTNRQEQYEMKPEVDEFERTILNESLERGYLNYEIIVQLEEDCLLKAARVFMIFEVLEEMGEVIKSDPPVNDLEDENFSHTFTVILVSRHESLEIEEKLKKISEIERVQVYSFSLSKLESKHNKENESNIDQRSIKDTIKSPQSATRKTIRVNIDRLDVLMNLFEELVIDRGRLEQISLELNHEDLKETVERMARVSGDLQNIILNMRMVPIDSVFNRFPRMIRQLARDLHKDIKTDIFGADTELDRTVIDEIGDPLVHLIRNAVDHGIETPEERKKKGKSEQGTMHLQAFQSGNSVFIEIMDDGAGINKQAVLTKAIKKGIVNKEQSELLTGQQVYELIMESGFSMADEVSDVSGRGVGLDVVKNTIETLGGNISIDSTFNQGSTFSIQLPLTLSIISALLVELKDEKYAIPLSSIIETTIIHQDEIYSAHNKKVIDFRGMIIPLLFLKTIFSIPNQENQSDYVSIVIVKKGNKVAGFVVDSLIGQQEVVLKSIGKYLSDIPSISGATILGDGQVALIIDSNVLIK